MYCKCGADENFRYTPESITVDNQQVMTWHRSSYSNLSAVILDHLGIAMMPLFNCLTGKQRKSGRVVALYDVLRTDQIMDR